MEVFNEAASLRSMGHFLLALEVPVLQETAQDWRIQLNTNMRVGVGCVKDGGTPGLRHPRARDAEHVGQVIRDPLFLVARGSTLILALIKPA